MIISMTDSTKESNQNIFKWDQAHSAVQEYATFSVLLSNLQLAGDYSYLVRGDAAILEYNPPIDDPFVFSASERDYADLTDAKKTLYKLEQQEYKKEAIQTTSLRSAHRKKCGQAISSLEALFEVSSNARKLLASTRMTQEALDPRPELHVVYLAQLAALKTRYAPNKPTDGAHWISMLVGINFADGRGFASNSNDFSEAMDALATMTLTPDRLLSQKYLSDALSKVPNIAPELIQMAKDNAADIATIAGGGIPARLIPTWKTCLMACDELIRNFPDWDTIGKATSSAPSTSYSATTYCPLCGRNNHTINCTWKTCICGVDIKTDPTHRATDKAHDKKRAEFNAGSGGRGRGSSDSRGGRSGDRGGRTGRGRGGRAGRGGRSGRGGRGDNLLTIPDGKSSKSGKSNTELSIMLAQSLTGIDKSVAAMAQACESNLKWTKRINEQLASDSEDESSNALVVKKHRSK
jgi:uncharacterized membrane protein YgcG